jgi:hypothetical protein
MTYTLTYTCCGEIKTFTNKRSWYNAKKKIEDTGAIRCQKCFGKDISKVYKGVKNPTYKRTFKDKTHFRNCPSCNIDMGYTSRKLLLNAINKKSICNSCSSLLYDKGGKLNNVLTTEMRLEAIAKREGYPDYKTYYATFQDRKKYHRRVWNLTYKQPIEFLENFDKRGKSGIDGAHQIDHIIPIKYGFENNIPAEEIAHINNLRMLTWEENISKGSKHYPYLR